LGAPFLRKHYVVFDYNSLDNPMMSFTYMPNTPSPTPDNDNTGSIVMGVILCIVVLGLIAGGIFFCVKKSNEREAKARTLIPYEPSHVTLPTSTNTYQSYNQ